MKTSVILTAVGYCLSAPGVSAPEIAPCARVAPVPALAAVVTGDPVGPPCLAPALPVLHPADPFWAPLPEGGARDWRGGSGAARPPRDLLPLSEDIWTLGFGAASPAFGPGIGLSLTPLQVTNPRGGTRIVLAIETGATAPPGSLARQLV